MHHAKIPKLLFILLLLYKVDAYPHGVTKNLKLKPLLMKANSFFPIAFLVYGCAMFMPGNAESQNLPSHGPRGKNVQVIELRNYMLRPGKRDSFIMEFENKILDTLNGRGNYVLGQYRVKGAEDNFLWIRGFHDMQSRFNAMKGFYSCKYWEEHVWIPIAYVLNYTNVHLLKPVDIDAKNNASAVGFECDWFGKPKGIAVIDYYYAANGWLDRLVEFMRVKYDPVLRASGINNVSYWISEQAINDYPDLPVYQDKNLLVTISFYENEQAYEDASKKIYASMSEEIRNEMLGIVPTKTTLVLHPTDLSFKVSH